MGGGGGGKGQEGCHCVAPAATSLDPSPQISDTDSQVSVPETVDGIQGAVALTVAHIRGRKTPPPSPQALRSSPWYPAPHGQI